MQSLFRLSAKGIFIFEKGEDVVSKSLGKILQRLRKEQGMSQKELSQGLCSVTTLSRFESGDREPDQILFEALVSRLGKDSTKWELILSENDKKLLEKRSYIEYLTRIGQWDEVEKELQEYEHFNGLSKTLHEQYQLYIKALLYGQNKHYEEAINACMVALDKTKVKIGKEKLLIEGELLSKYELRIVCFIGEILLEAGIEDLEKLYHYWLSIMKYVELRCSDEQYRLRFYSKVYYYLAYISYQRQEYKKSVLYSKKALEELIRRRRTYYLKQFIILINKIEKVYDISGILEIASMEDLNIVFKTLEEWEEINKNLEHKERYVRFYNGTYSINEIIKNMRKYCGKTQEGFMESPNGSVVSNQSALSKIENGKRSPRLTTKRTYLEALGLEGKEESYQLSIQGEDFEVQELQWEIDFYISTHEMGKAEELLWKLKEKIDLDNVYNQQYVRKVELFIRDAEETIPYEEYQKEIFSILELTIKDIDKIKENTDGQGFFTTVEIILLMNLGCAYHSGKEYEKALEYYQRVERYFSEFYPFSNANIYKTLLYDISQVYGLLGRYEESLEKCKICIFIEMFHEQALVHAAALYNIGWCYGKMMIMEQESSKKKEYYKKNCLKFLEQSCSIARFYKYKVVEQAIKEKRKLWEL